MSNPSGLPPPYSAAYGYQPPQPPTNPYFVPPNEAGFQHQPYPRVPPSAPPAPNVTTTASNTAAAAKPIFSWFAATVSFGCTLFIAYSVEIPNPNAVIISLLAGGLLGFVAAQEPTRRIQQIVTPASWNFSVFHGVTYTPMTVHQWEVVTHWGEHLLDFLALIILFQSQNSPRHPRSHYNSPHREDRGVPPLGNAVRRGQGSQVHQTTSRSCYWK